MKRNPAFAKCSSAFSGQRRTILAAGLAVVFVATGTYSQAQIVPPADDYQRVVGKAIDFLRTQGQDSNGAFSPQTGPAVTALVTTGLLRAGLTVNDPMVAKALKVIESHFQEDGGIYQSGSNHRNYETCIAIVCLKEANADGRYDEVLKRAEKYVKDQQHDEGEGVDPSDFKYGGAGYGRSQRPDLSNTSFLMDALIATGNGPDDENIRKALHFVSMCQNHESQYNTAPFAAKNPDGGFYYTVAAGGQSMAPATPDLPEGALRSYGSMTYAGLKSMIYAGVGPDDERVKAAVSWIAKNYDLSQNPGMGDAGLYYYYHTFAKALDALRKDAIADAQGNQHSWRMELFQALAERQKEDGSWTNENARWMEGDPNLVTGYCLLCLAYCKPN
jgi:squalene-hopene/tetraprenyl-beta-curcumene cyclase